MKEKYLPIGSVVKINNNDQKIMISGYYSLEYHDSIKIYDYLGFAYPEGLLIKNRSCSFNHEDISDVLFVGYEDDEYLALNNNLLGDKFENNVLDEDLNNLGNFAFDENGFVVADNLNSIPNNEKNASKPSKKEFLYNATPIVNESFAFDENGVITEDKTVVENTQDIESNFKYTFDENGFITGEVAVDIPSVNDSGLRNSNYIYEFDENGVVVGVTERNDNLQNVVPTNNLVFDENGVIVSDNAENNLNQAQNSATDYNLESYEIPTIPVSNNEDEFQMPHYQFDENGIIINN